MLLLSGILLSLIKVPVHAIPMDYNIGVPIVQQAKTNWCWAACGAAVINYYGGNITQYNFSFIVKGDSVNNDTATMAEEVYGLVSYGRHTHSFVGSLSFQDIQQNIYNWKRPIIVGLIYGHMVVISGYYAASGTGNEAVVMDPDPTYSGYQYWNMTSLSNYWYETINQIY